MLDNEHSITLSCQGWGSAGVEMCQYGSVSGECQSPFHWGGNGELFLCPFIILAIWARSNTLANPSGTRSPRSINITILMELTAQKGKGDRGKKDQRPRSNSGPTLYRGVSDTRATETGRDPLSPIAPMYRSQVCRYPATLKTCASRLVLCAM